MFFMNIFMFLLLIINGYGVYRFILFIDEFYPTSEEEVFDKEDLTDINNYEEYLTKTKIDKDIKDYFAGVEIITQEHEKKIEDNMK